jgi:hypothetical protein
MRPASRITSRHVCGGGSTNQLAGVLERRPVTLTQAEADRAAAALRVATTNGPLAECAVVSSLLGRLPGRAQHSSGPVNVRVRRRGAYEPICPICGMPSSPGMVSAGIASGMARTSAPRMRSTAAVP